MQRDVLKLLPVQFVAFGHPSVQKRDDNPHWFYWTPAAGGTNTFRYAAAAARVRLEPADRPSVFVSFRMPHAERLEPRRGMTDAAVTASPHTAAILAALTQLSEQATQAAPEPHATAYISSLLTVLLTELLVRHSVVDDAAHADDSAAAHAGLASREPAGPVNGRTLIYAVRYMKKRMYDPGLSLHDIAHAVGYHPNYFCFEFSKVFARSPIRFLNEMRLRHALRLLERTDQPLHAICKHVGIKNADRLTMRVKALTGKTPTQYRRMMKQIGTEAGMSHG